MKNFEENKLKVIQELVNYSNHLRELNQWANDSDKPKKAEDLEKMLDFEGDYDLILNEAKKRGIANDIAEEAMNQHYSLKMGWIKSLAESMIFELECQGKEDESKMIKDWIENNY